jgi:uncharacterized protein
MNIVSDRFRSSSRRVVIDTQTVLDWQFFRNPTCAGWPAPGPHWQWVATAAMRDELVHVLKRGFGKRWALPSESVLAFFDDHAQLMEPATPAAATARALRCTDPDDQKFIDLALVQGAQWLVSRDRAVLKLRHRAWAMTGLQIVSPADWQPASQ